MLETQHQTRTIQDFVDLYAKKRLNLAPAFQRQSVWSRSDREFLVQSVLEGVPLPSIYLYEQVGAGGVPKYDVIDGKQRLESILLFLGKGPLRHEGTLWTPRMTFNEDPLDWWDWSWLPKPIKNRFLTTKIATIQVDGDLGEIIDLFVRINATGKSLTGQEKRNARYFTSPVLKAGKRLAEEHRTFLLRNQVVSQSQVQRMKHVELMTELLLAINACQPLNKKTKIDEIIRGASVDADDLKRASLMLKRAIRLVEAVLPDLKTTRFHNGTDFYSLALLLHRYREESKSVTAHDSKRNGLAEPCSGTSGAQSMRSAIRRRR